MALGIGLEDNYNEPVAFSHVGIKGAVILSRLHLLAPPLINKRMRTQTLSDKWLGRSLALLLTSELCA